MVRAQKLRHLHEVGERHNDAQLCDYIGLRLALQLIHPPPALPELWGRSILHVEFMQSPTASACRLCWFQQVHSRMAPDGKSFRVCMQPDPTWATHQALKGGC